MAVAVVLLLMYMPNFKNCVGNGILVVVEVEKEFPLERSFMLIKTLEEKGSALIVAS